MTDEIKIVFVNGGGDEDDGGATLLLSLPEDQTETPAGQLAMACLIIIEAMLSEQPEGDELTYEGE